jgi:hypothetical protein
MGYTRHQIFLAICTVAKFVVPDWRDIIDSGMGLLSYRPARLHRLAAGTTTLCLSRLYPQVKDIRIGPQHGDCYYQSDSGSVAAVYCIVHTVGSVNFSVVFKISSKTVF